MDPLKKNSLTSNFSDAPEDISEPAAKAVARRQEGQLLLAQVGGVQLLSQVHRLQDGLLDSGISA